MFLFADDTKVARSIRNLDDSLQLQEDIKSLENWSNVWLLKFHPNKCHVLTLEKLNNIRHAHRDLLNGIELEHVFQEKDLGIIIDSEFTFEEHITEKVTPHLKYGQSVWSPHLRKHINLIEGAQRRATKFVDKLYHPTLKFRREFGDMIQVYTHLHHYCLLYTSPSPRDQRGSRMPSSA